jgi:hypothetical protein
VSAAKIAVVDWVLFFLTSPSVGDYTSFVITLGGRTRIIGEAFRITSLHLGRVIRDSDLVLIIFCEGVLDVLSRWIVSVHSLSR